MIVMNFQSFFARFCSVLFAIGCLFEFGNFVGANNLYAQVDLEGYSNKASSGQLYFDVQQSAVTWGQNLGVGLAVANFGNVNAGPFIVTVYISKTRNFVSNNPSVCYAIGSVTFSQGLGSLTANGTGNPNGTHGYANFTLPTSNPFGDGSTSFFVGMVVNPDHEVTESNYTNDANLGSGIDSGASAIAITAPEPTIQLSGSTLAFGNVAVDGSGGAVGSQTVTISNSGALPLTINSISTSGVPFQISSVVSNIQNLTLPGPVPTSSLGTFAFPIQINGNESWAINVTYDPTTVATHSGSLTINSNDPVHGTSTVTLGGTGIAVPHLSLLDPFAPTNDLLADYGSVVNDGTGGASSTQTFTLTNTGSGPLTISQNGISLTSTQSGVWTLVSITNSANFANSSFEYPAVGVGNSLLQPTASTWTFAGKAFIQSNGSSLGAANAPDGTQTAMLQGLPGNTLGSISQAVNFPVATTATVSFQAAQRTGFPAQPIKITVDGTQVGGLITPSSTTFQTYTTASFSVTAGSHSIQLSATDNSAEKDSFVDSVSLTSTTQGTVSLASGSKTIAANGAETWNVVVKFDPIANTSYLTSLQVLSNDPNLPTAICTLKGQGVIPMTLQVASSVNGQNDSNPLIMNFGSLHATGVQKLTGTVLLTNTGQQPLAISGLTLGSTTNFQITSITSNTQPTANLTSGGTIAPSGAETWTINLLYQPTVSGNDNTTLTILSNDPTHGTQPIALNATGLNQPGILVTTPHGGTTLPFGPVLNDGSGHHVGTQSFTVQNIGLQSLAIPANGIHLVSAPGYAVQSIVSSTQPGINLSSVTSGGGSIAANQTETWTVTVALDPTTNASYPGSLVVQDSNDPVTSSVTETLSGSGTVPSLTLNPQTGGLPTLYVQVGQVYNIAWTGVDTADTAPSATLTFSTAPTNSLPASGLTTIASIPFSTTTTSYAWRPTQAQVNQEFYIYGSLLDTGVSANSFSTQKIHVEAAGSFNLLSSLLTTSTSYAYQYIYNGKVYAGTTTLQPGQNVITITTPLAGGGNASHQITVTQTPSLLATQGYTYDELNRIKTYTNGNGITTTYTYDLSGNLLQTSAANGNVLTYSYDSLNRKTSMTDSTGTTFYDYDDLDRVTAITYSTDAVKGNSDDLVMGYQYDTANRITDITYPGGEHIQYTWDNAGRILTCNDLTTSQNSTYVYYPTTGLLNTLTRADGVVTTYGYDGMGRLNDIKHKKGSTLLAEYSYTLNSLGNATAVLTTFSDGSQKQEQYTYDGLNHLTQVIYGSTATAGPNDKTLIYTYDSVGNRLTQTTKLNGAVTQTLTYAYGSENRLLSVTDQNKVQLNSYVYDAAGNRVQKVTPSGNTYYSYDERNLLTSVVTPSDYILYAYNCLGQRVSKTIDGVTTSYIVDPSQNVFQTVQERSGGAITTSHVYGIDRLQSNPAAGTSQFYLPDRIGSVRLVTDPTGNITANSNFDAFGVKQ